MNLKKLTHSNPAKANAPKTAPTYATTVGSKEKASAGLLMTSRLFAIKKVGSLSTPSVKPSK